MVRTETDIKHTRAQNGLLYRTRKFEKNHNNNNNTVVVVVFDPLFDVPARVFQVQIFPSAIDPTSYCVLRQCAAASPPPPPLPTEIFALTCCVVLYTAIKIYNNDNNNTNTSLCIHRTKSVSDTVLALCHWTP